METFSKYLRMFWIPTRIFPIQDLLDYGRPISCRIIAARLSLVRFFNQFVQRSSVQVDGVVQIAGESIHL